MDKKLQIFRLKSLTVGQLAQFKKYQSEQVIQ